MRLSLTLTMHGEDEECMYTALRSNDSSTLALESSLNRCSVHCLVVVPPVLALEHRPRRGL